MMMRDLGYTTHELQAAHTILSYLTKHPSSSDTVQGIVEWWFKRERLEYTEKQIRRALGLLVGRGLVTVKQYSHQPEFYQMGTNQGEVIDHAIQELAAHVNRNTIQPEAVIHQETTSATSNTSREIFSSRFYKLATWLLGMNWLLTLLKLNLILK